jgi:hypothetical protein
MPSFSGHATMWLACSYLGREGGDRDFLCNVHRCEEFLEW